MSDFEVPVLMVNEVIDHPNADRLSIVRVRGYESISAKNEDGSHRFAAGEPIIYVPEGAVVPEDHLKLRGFWDDGKDRGMLAGKRGDRVKAIRLRGVLSQGLVWKLGEEEFDGLDGPNRLGESLGFWCDNGERSVLVSPGQCVADFFGISKYEPPVPTHLAGDCCGVLEAKFEFDIENYQKYPDFLVNDEVEATEKLHGTYCRISFVPGLRHPEMFGETEYGRGCVTICSKGMGGQGLVFKNSEANRAKNVYVRVALELDLIAKLERYAFETSAIGHTIHLMGEIFGAGVQDLHYGQKTPTFRAFDITLDGHYLGAADKARAFDRIGVERVPVLYRGPWDLEKLTQLRDGKTMFDGANIREGIVVTAVGSQQKRQADLNHSLRPILKMVSPDYLTRKGETTEFQ